MAEMIFKGLLKESGITGVRVSSAGLSAHGGYISEEAFQTLKKNGCRLTQRAHST